MEGTSTTISEALADFLRTYQDFNSNAVDELHKEPSGLGFMRYVSRNRPFVIRGGCKDWPACRKWSADYLAEILGDSLVNVAVTPHGYAKTTSTMGSLDLGC